MTANDRQEQVKLTHTICHLNKFYKLFSIDTFVLKTTLKEASRTKAVKGEKKRQHLFFRTYFRYVRIELDCAMNRFHRAQLGRR